jgi:hypothetical protein
VGVHTSPRSPTDAWTAQQLREDIAYGVGPKYLIRDNDGKFGVGFARVTQTSRIEILTTPYFAPRANAICERFLLSVRRECLDHLLILHEKQLHRVLNAYVQYAQPSQAASRDQACRFQSSKLGQRHPIVKVARSSPSRPWAACIMTTAEVPEFVQR